MAMTGIEFREYMEEKHRRQGFKDGYEAFAVSFNWRETFGTDLPENYYHPRDHIKLDDAMYNLMLADDLSDN